jgi:hypothetical protein
MSYSTADTVTFPTTHVPPHHHHHHCD